jgi:hypothetical protein
MTRSNTTADGHSWLRLSAALTAAVGLLLLVVPSARAVVLYDQTDSPADPTFVTGSQDFEASLDKYDDTAADDFTVPPGQSWTIDRVDVLGSYSAAGPASSSRVKVYEASGTLPGASVFTSISMPADGGVGPNFALPVSGAPALPPGHYWVSVQAILDLVPGGLWFWRERTAQSGDPAVWENPADGFGTGCTTFKRLNDCAAVPQFPDLAFRLNGSIGSPAVPPPPPEPPEPPPDDGAPAGEFSLGKVKKNTKKGTAKLTVNVPAPGQLALAKNKKVKGTEKTADAAGKEKLPIKPKGKAKKKLNQTGKAKVNAKVTYMPDITFTGGGESETKSKNVGLKKR